MKAKIVVNAIMAMDGTILQSHYRHDYKDYQCVVEDKVYNCSIDGGYDYLARSGKFTEMSLFEDSDFLIIRRFLCRGGRGEDSKQPLQYIPLFRINDEWLVALIEYVDKNNRFLKYYQMEKEYRCI
jgi:hypothetical protein